MNIIVRDGTRERIHLGPPAGRGSLQNTMPPTDASAKVYQELADWYEQQRDGPMRDRFLLLAAASLLSSGHKDEAEKIRLRLLKLNPNHLVKPFPSMAEAVKSRDVREYIEGLRRNYSPPAASQLLESLRGRSGGTPRQSPAPTATGPAEDLPVLEPIVCAAHRPENVILRRKMRVRHRKSLRLCRIRRKANPSRVSAVRLACGPRDFALPGARGCWRPTSPTRPRELGYRRPCSVPR